MEAEVWQTDRNTDGPKYIGVSFAVSEKRGPTKFWTRAFTCSATLVLTVQDLRLTKLTFNIMINYRKLFQNNISFKHN